MIFHLTCEVLERAQVVVFRWCLGAQFARRLIIAGVCVGLAALGDASAQPAGKGASPAAPQRAQAGRLRADQIALLEDALASAPEQGLSSALFTDDYTDLLASADPDARREGETRLVARTLAYARAVHAGALRDADFLYPWGLRPQPYDPAPGFRDAVQTDRLQAWLTSLPPQYTGYDALRKGLATYREIAAKGGWSPISAGGPIAKGSTGKRVAELRARLAAEDGSVSAAGPAVYDADLAAAVARAQKRFGLEPTGTADAATLTALNVPIRERINQILANMERWRWLPASLPSDRIQVNIAAAVLSVFKGDAPIFTMRAATGKPGDETPMLSSVIQSIVINPPWNVPSDIATKELFPKERAHPGYFARNEFVVIRSPDGSSRLQQKAGDKSALGHVKFDFANKYGVYLHDTPTHSTFSKYGRLVSHGCVRLEKPVALAELLMSGTEWTPERIHDQIEDGDTVRAPLPKPIAVYLLYWTAYVGPDGQVNFRDDPYNWDSALTKLLESVARSQA